jgi:tRNA modification GTPase
MLAVNKSDLPTGRDRRALAGFAKEYQVLEVSATEGDVGSLRAALSMRVADDLAGAEFPAATRARHEQLLRDALGRLRDVDKAALETPELAAEDLRLAARAMERVTGRIGAEDVLDVVFGAFCIGK